MAFTWMRAAEAFFALIRKNLTRVLEHKENFSDYSDDTLKTYIQNSTLLALCWGLGGDIKLL